MTFQKGHIPWNKGKKCPQISESKKGEKNPMYGKHFSEEHRRNISEGKLKRKKELGYVNSPEARRNISEGMKGEKNPMYGKHRSQEHRRKMSDALRGEKNWRWKGGKLPYYGPNWEQQKRLARQRDKGICQDCGTKEDGRKHDTHHIIPFRVYGLERYEEANRVENLMTLCQKCHTRIEAITVLS